MDVTCESWVSLVSLSHVCHMDVMCKVHGCCVHRMDVTHESDGCHTEVAFELHGCHVNYGCHL